MYEENALQVEEFVKRLEELRACLNLDEAKKEIATLEEAMAAQDFWDDQETAQKAVQRLKSLKATVSVPEELLSELEDAQVLIELAQQEEEESMGEEIEATLTELAEELDQVEVTSLLDDPRDAKNAIVNIHPGAGRDGILRLGRNALSDARALLRTPRIRRRSARLPTGRRSGT